MMYLDFKIKLLKIQIKLLEVDEMLPSFKVRLDVHIFHPTGEFIYSADDLWFECRKWDDFTHRIALIKGDDAINLDSISEEFALKLSADVIKIVIKERSFNNFVVELNHSQRLTADEMYILKDSFLRLDRWW